MTTLRSKLEGSRHPNRRERDLLTSYVGFPVFLAESVFLLNIWIQWAHSQGFTTLDDILLYVPCFSLGAVSIAILGMEIVQALVWRWWSSARHVGNLNG